MRNFKNRVLSMETKLRPAAPAVIFAEFKTEAEEKLAEYREQYGEFVRPIVYIAPNFFKAQR